MNIFARAGIDEMDRFLDFTSLKQQIITSNIANIETPGYRARSLDFQSVFRDELGSGLALKATRADHFRTRPRLIREPEIAERATDALGNDLNNVDIDQEMTNLAENVLRFETVAQLLQSKLQIIRSAIQGG